MRSVRNLQELNILWYNISHSILNNTIYTIYNSMKEHHKTIALVILGFFITIASGILGYKGISYLKEKNMKQYSSTPSYTLADIKEPKYTDVSADKNDMPYPTVDPRYRIELFSYKDGGFASFYSIDAASGGQFGQVEPVLIDNKTVVYSENPSTVRALDFKSKEPLFTYTLAESGMGVSRITYEEGQLYLSVYASDIYNKNAPKKFIEVLDATTGQVVRRISDLPEDSYYGITRYAGTYVGGDLFLLSGGDGCGGYNLIYRSQNLTEPLFKGGAGCVNDPRYITYDKKNARIISAPAVGKTFPDTALSRLEAVSVPSGTVQTLLEFDQFESTISAVVADAQVNRVALYGDKTAYIVDMNTLQVTHTVALPKSDSFNIVELVDNELLMIDLNAKNMLIVPLDGSEVIIKPMEIINSSRGNSPRFMNYREPDEYIFYSFIDYF